MRVAAETLYHTVYHAMADLFTPCKGGLVRDLHLKGFERPAMRLAILAERCVFVLYSIVPL